jgi:4-hydroxymandelate oxidase
LQGAAPPIEVLPEVVEAVDGGAEVFLDGGVRRGSDVLKALALGARAVLIGRPMLWGLAAGGEEGVRRCLEILSEELSQAMVLCGTPRLDLVGPQLVHRAS